MLLVALLSVLVAGLGPAAAYTDPDQIAKLQALKAQLSARGPVWTQNLANWTCPTPAATSSSNESCDPCGRAQWWGNWDYIGCRGVDLKGALYARGNLQTGEDILGGNGLVTNVHFTDFGGEGPTLPIADICVFSVIKELDIAGQGTKAIPMAGTLPPELGYCFPLLNAVKFSFNQLTGTLPEFMANITGMQEMKIRGNQLTGTLPSVIGTMPSLYYLDLSLNQMHGSIPSSFQNSDTFGVITLANMSMSGNLYGLGGTQMLLTELTFNQDLCGMVPGPVRYARGYNPVGTNLGKPCPGETYPPSF